MEVLMTPKWRSCLRWIALTICLSVGLALGQQAAELVGKVLDQSGAVIPNASVEATNESTGITRQVLTNALGEYRLAPLAPGAYNVKVMAQGFRTTVQSGLELQVNQVA